MIDSNETLMYDSGRDAGYSEGYNDALKNVAQVISDRCAKGCPFKDNCDVYSDEACIARIIRHFKKELDI